MMPDPCRLCTVTPVEIAGAHDPEGGVRKLEKLCAGSKRTFTPLATLIMFCVIPLSEHVYMVG